MSASDTTPEQVSTSDSNGPASVTMPDASIKAANEALTQSLESANIVPDEPLGGDSATSGDDKTVFHDQANFNVKVRIRSSTE